MNRRSRIYGDECEIQCNCGVMGFQQRVGVLSGAWGISGATEMSVKGPNCSDREPLGLTCAVW